jgi:glycosyltransferase involved in cell wall biosynthesis
MAHFLWLTLCDPHPKTNGQFLYSGGLICAVGQAGARVTVLGLSRQAGDREPHDEPTIDWCLATDCPTNPLRRAVSRFPSGALRTRVPEMRAMLDDKLRLTNWDALVMDSINVGWALPHLIRYRRKQPRARLAYLAQNNETEAARELARVGKGWRKGVRLLEVAKTRILESQLARSADLVTTDAPEDCTYLSRLSGGRPVVFVPPGYEGNRVRDRTIGTSIPRRAIIVGSFDWPAKRASLEAFLVVAAELFQERGIELQVIGRTDPGYVALLRARFPTVQFVGSVAEVQSYMANARIGLIPDLLGSFKLKSLDYVFSRLPIFGILGAVPGLGLEVGQGIRLVKTHGELAAAVVEAIDDFSLLNRLQNAAFEQCESRFEWNAIGDHLLHALSGGQAEGSGLAAYSYSAASVSTRTSSDAEERPSVTTG